MRIQVWSIFKPLVCYFLRGDPVGPSATAAHLHSLLFNSTFHAKIQKNRGEQALINIRVSRTLPSCLNLSAWDAKRSTYEVSSPQPPP